MGGINSFEEHESGGRSPGKIDTSLRAQLDGAQWGEVRIGDLFDKVYTAKLPYKARELPTERTKECTLPALTSSFVNQGLSRFVPTVGATILSRVITIPSNSDVYRSYFHPHEFTVLSDAYAIRWNGPEEISDRAYVFMTMCINKVTDLPLYSYKQKLGGWNVVRDKRIAVPICGDSLDFSLMESVITELETRHVTELEARHAAELEAYLSSAGLSDCTLGEADDRALQALDSADWEFFNLKDLFGPATRGKRLKSADRTEGALPFVTAGESNTGISAFIGNNVQVFPAGSFTIDMFGSAKFRNYNYGGDDHVAVVHTENLTRNAAIFVTSAAHKAAHTGAFDYGRNFYAKDADALDISLPVKDSKPDWELMDAVIGATHKLVVQGVAEFAAHEIEASRQIIGLGVE